MKFLILQERGRHEKNREFREALCMQRALDSLGHECVVWGLNYDNFFVPFNEISRDVDVLISLENYDTGWHPDISSFKGLKIFWSIDAHCALGSHIEHCKINKFDIILSATERYLEFFKPFTNNQVWFPNAYPDDLIFPDASVSKQYDVGFCGSMIADRPQWVPMLEKEFGNRFKKDIFVIGDDMVNAIRSYKIGVNKCIADDINYRVFETLGCGTVLVTNRVPNLEKLFVDGEHLVTYDTIPEMIEKTKHLLNDQAILLKISQSGHEHVKKHHTYLERAKILLEIL